MSKTAMIRAEIEPKLKSEVENILAQLGLSASDTINLLYRQIKVRRGLPFEVTLRPRLDLSNATLAELEARYRDRVPNRQTTDALSEPARKSKRFKTAEALFKDLGV
jgi:addiction module RelB/DinJ family antitoxin